MKTTRTLVYALVILAITHALALTVQLPAVTFVLAHADLFGFLPISLSMASAITRDRPILGATVLLVLMLVLPGPIEAVARALWPIGVGIVLGTIVGKAIRDAKEQHGESVPREDHPTR